MGYSVETVNVFGFTLNLDEEEDMLLDDDELQDHVDPFKESAYAFIHIGGFNGADSRIHLDQFVAAVILRNYSWSSCSYKGLNGDVHGSPNESEISEFKEFCLKNKIPWKEPERIVRTYTI